MARVIIGRDAPTSAAAGPAVGMTAAVIPPLTAFGLVLVGVGIIDLGMLWTPFRFGSGEWEFGTASRTFDSLALGTTGIVFLVASAAARNSVLALRMLTAACVMVAIGLIGAFTLYGLNVPTALRAVDEATRPLLIRAVFRTSAFAVLYVVLFGWLAWFTWRRGGAATRGVQS